MDQLTILPLLVSQKVHKGNGRKMGIDGGEIKELVLQINVVVEHCFFFRSAYGNALKILPVFKRGFFHIYYEYVFAIIS